MSFQLKYNSINRIKNKATDALLWVDYATVKEIAEVLKEIVIKGKNEIGMDEHEQVIWDTIKTEHVSKSDKEINKELIGLRARVEALEKANNILRNANKKLMSMTS